MDALPSPRPAPPTRLGAEVTSLRTLVHHCWSVADQTPLEDVQRMFEDKRVDFLAITHDGRVTGLCSRLRVGILLGTRFGFSLNSRSPAHVAQVPHPLIFTESTPVRQILDEALARRGDDFHEDITLLDPEGGLLGLVPVDTLARLQSRLVAEQVDELSRQHLELFQATNALRQSQGLYLGLFKGHALGVALLDDLGQIHEHNQRLAQLLNLGSGSVALASLAAWVAEAERAVFLEHLASHARDSAPPSTREFTLNIPGRGARLFRCSTGWIGETGQICACLDDITEQRAVERHLARREKQTLLDTLVGGIAHELNNKLTPVLGFSELIQLDGNEQTRVHAGLIATCVGEAATIIRQLLQLSKPGAAVNQTVDLRTVVDEALTMLQFKIREARCAVHKRAPSTPVWVEADAAHLKQVVLNLALNALQATENCNAREFAVEVHASDQRATLVVADNGAGISPDNIGRIFDPFFTTKGPEKGTGLGLSVCYSIVRQHGGEIGVESSPGAGARFTVTLPLAPSVPLFADSSLSTDSSIENLRAFKGARVLVVEDEVVVARLVQEVLRKRFGCQVDWEENGRLAVERVARADYSLVISDIRMPHMNGSELYLRLRELRPALARRFIFVTGHPGESHLDAEIAQWNVPIVAKPFSVAQLSDACAPFLQAPGAFAVPT